MNNYYISSSNNELYHYGIKGMKWGVRKEQYKAMNRHQRKATREKYYQTTEGKKYKVSRNAIIGTVLGGPLVGVAAGLVTAKRNGLLQKRVSQGKKYVERLATTRTVELKTTRVTGQEEADFWKALAETYDKQ